MCTKRAKAKEEKKGGRGNKKQHKNLAYTQTLARIFLSLHVLAVWDSPSYPYPKIENLLGYDT